MDDDKATETPQETARVRRSALNDLLCDFHTPVESIGRRISQDMMRQKDAIIVEAIAHRLGRKDWEIIELIGRGDFVIDRNGYELFSLDGEELVQFHPVIFIKDDNTNTMTASQSYKLLYT